MRTHRAKRHLSVCSLGQEAGPTLTHQAKTQMHRIVASALIAGVGLGAGTVSAQRVADTTAKVTFGGFVDTYFAWDFGRPPSFDRSFATGVQFTTQPARHNEFNVNLAFIEARLDGELVHGRVALQAGTSVQSNYAAEPTKGTVSGPGLTRHIQEAYAGARLSPGLWIDAGIFYSHMGAEAWASRDNATYSRSLVADYSPYYSSGVRAAWQATPRLMARIDVVNGWQNVSENNSGKGIGTRFDYALTRSVTLSYYDFFSNEAGNRCRAFNGLSGKATIGRMMLLGELDVGTQSKSAASGGSAMWWGYTAVVRGAFTSVLAVVGRIEAFDDKDQVIVATGDSARPLRTIGASFGIDVVPQVRLLWRTELRGFRNRTGVFPNGANGYPRRADAFIVTSLGATF